MLEIRTLGGLSVTNEGALCGGAAAQRKTLALLALLAASDKGMSRDKLIAYLWPDSDDAHARNLLNQACYALRRDLGAPDLFLGSADLRLNPTVIASDVQALGDALRSGDESRAVQVYVGPFLDGFYVSESGEFERWVDAQRGRLAQQYANALESLARAAAARGDHRDSAEWWHRLVEADPLSSEAALGFASALDASGKRAEALRSAQVHAAHVRHELGAEPGPAVVALIHRLQRPFEDDQPGAPVSGTLPASLLERVRQAQRLSRIAVGAAAIMIAALAAAAVWGWHFRTGALEPVPVADRKMLAVLPFENRGAPAEEYFADGLTEAIATRLGSVRRLGVIAWQSTIHYKATKKSPQEIGRELGVQYILDGTVHWEKTAGASRIRVSPTLIRVSDAAQIWADQYDTTLIGVFAVEANLSSRVAGALDIALADAERRLLQDRPTTNLKAYDAYLRGRAAIDKDWDLADLKTALQMFERAVALDSGFAVAWAWSSVAHIALYWNYVDRDLTQLRIGKTEADRALRLAPELPEAHGAIGWYLYAALRDWDQALQEYSRARRARPSDPYLTMRLGAINEHKGNWSEALAYRHEAVVLSPLSGGLAAGLGNTYTRLREFAAANYYYDRALALTPRSVSARVTRALGYLNMTGDLKSAQRLFPDVSENMAPTGLEDVVLTLSEIVLLLSDEQQTKLLALTPAAMDGDTAGLALARALVYWRRDKALLARAAFDSARLVLQGVVERKPDDHVYHALLGLALAGLGRPGDAVREGEQAIALLPVSRDAFDGALLPANLARIYVLLGAREKAIDQLEAVFSRPGPLSPHWLKRDPFWDSLRASPRFQRLVAASN